jgi:phosphoribosylformylglycinamidine synthase
MATYTARVVVRLNAGVNDPQGNTVRSGLQALGHDVRSVRVGKVVDLALDAASTEDAQRRVESMCQDLLANPVIESFTIELVAAD